MTRASQSSKWWWPFHEEKLLAHIDMGFDNNASATNLCPPGYSFAHIIIHAPPVSWSYASMNMLHEYIRAHALEWMNQQVTIFFDLEEQRFIVIHQSPVGNARGLVAF